LTTIGLAERIHHQAMVHT